VLVVRVVLFEVHCNRVACRMSLPIRRG